MTKFEFTLETNDYVVKEFVSTDQLEYQNEFWAIFGIYERYSGPFSHPNYMGTYLSLILIVLVGAKKRIFIPFILPGTLLLILTSSRGSMLATLIAWLIIFTLDFRRQFQRKYTLSLSKLVYIPITFIALSIIYVIYYKLTLTGRIGLWSQYLILWRESPVFGKGVALRSVENSFIYTLTSLGLVGIFLMLRIYKIAFSSLPRIVQRDSVLPVALLSWIAIRGIADSIHTFSGWNSGNLAFLILGLLSQQKNQPDKTESVT
jgi:hypothetical protein